MDLFLLAVCQVQLGIVLDPVAPSARGELDFDKLLSAYRRGCEVTIDFNDGWDYWAVMSEPVAALRTQYGIRPKAEFA